MPNPELYQMLKEFLKSHDSRVKKIKELAIAINPSVQSKSSITN